MRVDVAEDGVAVARPAPAVVVGDAAQAASGCRRAGRRGCWRATRGRRRRARRSGVASPFVYQSGEARRRVERGAASGSGGFMSSPAGRPSARARQTPARRRRRRLSRRRRLLARRPPGCRPLGRARGFGAAPRSSSGRLGSSPAFRQPAGCDPPSSCARPLWVPGHISAPAVEQGPPASKDTRRSLRRLPDGGR